MDDQQSDSYLQYIRDISRIITRKREQPVADLDVRRQGVISNTLSDYLKKDSKLISRDQFNRAIIQLLNKHEDAENSSIRDMYQYLLDNRLLTPEINVAAIQFCKKTNNRYFAETVYKGAKKEKCVTRDFFSVIIKMIKKESIVVDLKDFFNFCKDSQCLDPKMVLDISICCNDNNIRIEEIITYKKGLWLKGDKKSWSGNKFLLYMQSYAGDYPAIKAIYSEAARHGKNTLDVDEYYIIQSLRAEEYHDLIDIYSKKVNVNVTKSVVCHLIKNKRPQQIRIFLSLIPGQRQNNQLKKMMLSHIYECNYKENSDVSFSEQEVLDLFSPDSEQHDPFYNDAPEKISNKEMISCIKSWFSINDYNITSINDSMLCYSSNVPGCVFFIALYMMYQSYYDSRQQQLKFKITSNQSRICKNGYEKHKDELKKACSDALKVLPDDIKRNIAIKWQDDTMMLITRQHRTTQDKSDQQRMSTRFESTDVKVLYASKSQHRSGKQSTLLPVIQEHKKNTHAQFCYQIGWQHEHVTKNYTLSLAAYHAAAKQGHVKATNQLGTCYERGRGTPADANMAMHYYHIAARKNYLPAMYNVARMCDEPYPQRAEQWRTIAIHKNFPPALLDKGKDYEKKNDNLHSIWYYQCAAQNGSPEAQFRLAQFHILDESTNRKNNKAMKYYQSAAQQGHAGAQYALFQLLRGDQKTTQEADTWCKQAAQRGHSKAQYHLGLSLIDKNPDRAHQWLRHAAYQNLFTAQMRLAVFYAERELWSLGVAWWMYAHKQNYDQAYSALKGYCSQINLNTDKKYTFG